MIVGILQCGHLPEEIESSHGKYSDMIERLLQGHDFDYRVFNVVDGIFPDSPSEADAWMITGSRHGVLDGLPWIAPLENMVRAIHTANLPLVGICFGHQIIAQALGGRVEKFAGGWSLGLKDYQIGSASLKMAAWHQDQVVTPPQGAHVLGSHPTCANAVMAIGDKILTVQPHPEFSRPVVAGLVTHRGGALPRDLVDDAERSLGDASDRDVFGAWIADVLEGAPADQIPSALRAKASA